MSFQLTTISTGVLVEDTKEQRAVVFSDSETQQYFDIKEYYAKVAATAVLDSAEEKWAEKIFGGLRKAREKFAEDSTVARPGNRTLVLRPEVPGEEALPELSVVLEPVTEILLAIDEGDTSNLRWVNDTLVLVTSR